MEFLSTAKTYEFKKIFGNVLFLKSLFYQTDGEDFFLFTKKSKHGDALSSKTCLFVLMPILMSYIFFVKSNQTWSTLIKYISRPVKKLV